MLKIDEETIYDPATGICYTLSDGWNYAQTREEAKEAGELWTVVSVGSVHGGGENYGLTFEKESAVRLWQLLNKRVTN